MHSASSRPSTRTCTGATVPKAQCRTTESEKPSPETDTSRPPFSGNAAGLAPATRASPAALPEKGGLLVSVSGEGFSDSVGLHCALGTVAPVQARVLGLEDAECMAVAMHSASSRPSTRACTGATVPKAQCRPTESEKPSPETDTSRPPFSGNAAGLARVAGASPAALPEKG